MQPHFSGCENDCFIAHAFLSNKHNQSCSKSLHQNGATLNKERFYGQIEKLIQISPARTVTICDMHKSNSGFCTSLDTLAEVNLRLKLFLKTSNFFVWRLLFFRQKKKFEGRWDIEEILGVGSRNFQWLANLKHKHLVTWLL